MYIKTCGLIACVTIFWSIQKVTPLIQRISLPTGFAKCLNTYHYRTNIREEVALSILHQCLSEYHWKTSKFRVYPGKDHSTDATRQYTKRCLQRVLHKKTNRVKRQAGQGPRQDHGQGPGQGQGPDHGQGPGQGHGPDHGQGPGPDHGPPRRRIRKEYRRLTENERYRFHHALNVLKYTMVDGNYSRYDIIADYHTGMSQFTAHGGCNFLGWHRCYLMMLEEALQEIDPTVTIPYWDSVLDHNMGPNMATESVIFHPDFMGGGNGFVTDGPFANWSTPTGLLTRNIGVAGSLYEEEEIENMTRAVRMREICGGDAPIRSDHEYHHGDCHMFIDGTMGFLETAPHDPFFFLHHAMVDHIFELYRENARKNGTDIETDYPEDYGESYHAPNEAMGEFMEGLTVLDGLDNFFTEEIYGYERRPRCSRGNQDCGTPLLRCIRKEGRGRGREKYVCASITMDEYEDLKNGGGDLCTTQAPPTTTTTTTTSTTTTTTSTTTPSTTTTPYPTTPRPPPPRPRPNYGKFGPGLHRPIQNSFCANGQSDVKHWVYIPIRVTIQRAPDFGSYGSYRVSNGQADMNSDIYAPQAYSKIGGYIKPGRPRDYGNCKSTYSGAGEIYIQTFGLNYDGKYTEFAIVDHRLAISMSVAYVAVKDPQEGQSDVFISAYDSCGRVCRPSCLVPGTNLYRPCTGALRLTSQNPKMFGANFGESVLGLWNFTQVKRCPQFVADDIYVSFFCDYSDRWPWDMALKQPGAEVTPKRRQQPINTGRQRPRYIPPAFRDRFAPRATNPPAYPPVTQPPIRPMKSCVLNKFCTISLEDCNAPCVEQAMYPCDGFCNRYSKCAKGRYYVQQCYRMHFDSVEKRCMKGQGHCKDKEWRPWKKRTPKKRKRRITLRKPRFRRLAKKLSRIF